MRVRRRKLEETTEADGCGSRGVWGGREEHPDKEGKHKDRRTRRDRSGRRQKGEKQKGGGLTLRVDRCIKREEWEEELRGRGEEKRGVSGRDGWEGERERVGEGQRWESTIHPVGRCEGRKSHEAASKGRRGLDRKSERERGVKVPPTRGRREGLRLLLPWCC